MKTVTATYVDGKVKVWKRRCMKLYADSSGDSNPFDTRRKMCIRDRPYIISNVKNNNTYEIKEIHSDRIKGVYNQASMKKYYE